MTAPPVVADVTLTAILLAGLAALGIPGAVHHAAPLVCGCLEVLCDGDHLWITLTAAAQQARAGEAA